MPQALLAGLLAAAAGLVAALVAAWMYGTARATRKRAEEMGGRRRDAFGQYAALTGLLLSLLLVAAGIIVGVVQEAPGPVWARWVAAGLATAIALMAALAVTARLADRAEDVRLRNLPAARPELAGRDEPSTGPNHRADWGHGGEYDRRGWPAGPAPADDRGWPGYREQSDWPGHREQSDWPGYEESNEAPGNWPEQRGWSDEPQTVRQRGGWPSERFDDEPATAHIPPSADAEPEPDSESAVVPAMTYVPYGDAENDLEDDAPDTSPVEDAETLVREVQPGLVYRDAAGSWFLGVADPYGVPRPLLRLPGFSATTAHEPVYPLDVMGSVEIAVMPLDADGEEDGEHRAAARAER